MKKYLLVLSVAFIVVVSCACASKPVETTAPATTEPPKQVVVKPGSNTEKDYLTYDHDKVTYWDYYQNMTGEEQAAFISSFESYEDFFAWDVKAKADYQASLGEITPDGIVMPATEPSLTKPAN